MTYGVKRRLLLSKSDVCRGSGKIPLTIGLFAGE
jgi:hypothetical protein